MYGDPGNLIKDIEVWSWASIRTGKGIHIHPSKAKLLKPNFPHNCLSLDLTKNKYIKEQGVKNIFITFHKRSGFGVELFLEDRHISCSRTIIYSSLTQDGANIGLDDLDKTVRKRYVVKINENIRLEENPLADCRNYPNKDYASYNDCDEDFVIKIFQKYFGFYPIWATGNKSLVAENANVINLDAFGEGEINYYDLRDGDISNCTLPCRSSSLTCAFLTEFASTTNSSMINIAFDPRAVLIKEYSSAVDWTGLLADLGGCMGVWLGLGAVQILQVALCWEMNFSFRDLLILGNKIQ